MCLVAHVHFAQQLRRMLWRERHAGVQISQRLIGRILFIVEVALNSLHDVRAEERVCFQRGG